MFSLSFSKKYEQKKCNPSTFVHERCLWLRLDSYNEWRKKRRRSFFLFYIVRPVRVFISPVRVRLVNFSSYIGRSLVLFLFFIFFFYTFTSVNILQLTDRDKEEEWVILSIDVIRKKLLILSRKEKSNVLTVFFVFYDRVEYIIVKFVLFCYLYYRKVHYCVRIIKH